MVCSWNSSLETSELIASYRIVLSGFRVLDDKFEKIQETAFSAQTLAHPLYIGPCKITMCNGPKLACLPCGQTSLANSDFFSYFLGESVS